MSNLAPIVDGVELKRWPPTAEEIKAYQDATMAESLARVEADKRRRPSVGLTCVCGCSIDYCQCGWRGCWNEKR